MQRSAQLLYVRGFCTDPTAHRARPTPTPALATVMLMVHVARVQAIVQPLQDQHLQAQCVLTTAASRRQAAFKVQLHPRLRRLTYVLVIGAKQAVLQDGDAIRATRVSRRKQTVSRALSQASVCRTTVLVVVVVRSRRVHCVKTALQERVEQLGIGSSLCVRPGRAPVLLRASLKLHAWPTQATHQDTAHQAHATRHHSAARVSRQPQWAVLRASRLAAGRLARSLVMPHCSIRLVRSVTLQVRTTVVPTRFAIVTEAV